MASDPPAHRAVASRILILVVTWIGLTGVLLGAGELVTHWSVIEQFDRHITSWVVAHRSHAAGYDHEGDHLVWLLGGGSRHWWDPPGLGGRSQAAVGCCDPGRRRLGWVRSLQSISSSPWWIVNDHRRCSGWSRARGIVSVWACSERGVGLRHLGLCLVHPHRLAGRPDSGVVVSALGVLTVGFSRVELGVHWMTDVVAGFLVAAAWLVGIGLLFAYRVPLPAFPSPRGAGPERSGHPDVLADLTRGVGPEH